MYKLTISVVTALLLATSGMALAKDYEKGPQNKGKRPHRGMQTKSPTQRLMGAVHRLDLSEEQKENVWDIMHTMKGDMHKIMAESKATKQQLGDLVRAADYDQKAVEALAEKEGDLAAQRIMLTSEAISNVLAQLTDEQRTQLETMKAERKQRGKGDRGKRRAQRRPAPPVE